mmetsp:Transcript_21713/g.61044  ORF Transcript_21713/g.61044 Transcript_21713/m.61044 type:complete len:211 (+) Transcript_21713:57-689(+)
MRVVYVNRYGVCGYPRYPSGEERMTLIFLPGFDHYRSPLSSVCPPLSPFDLGKMPETMFRAQVMMRRHGHRDFLRLDSGRAWGVCRVWHWRPGMLTCACGSSWPSTYRSTGWMDADTWTLYHWMIRHPWWRLCGGFSRWSTDGIAPPLPPTPSSWTSPKGSPPRIAPTSLPSPSRAITRISGSFYACSPKHCGGRLHTYPDQWFSIARKA